VLTTSGRWCLAHPRFTILSLTKFCVSSVVSPIECANQDHALLTPANGLRYKFACFSLEEICNRTNSQSSKHCTEAWPIPIICVINFPSKGSVSQHLPTKSRVAFYKDGKQAPKYPASRMILFLHLLQCRKHEYWYHCGHYQKTDQITCELRREGVCLNKNPPGGSATRKSALEYLCPTCQAEKDRKDKEEQRWKREQEIDSRLAMLKRELRKMGR
jgi:hypothetical protein